MKGSGTDADVFLNIFGEYGDTGRATTTATAILFYFVHLPLKVYKNTHQYMLVACD